MNDRAWTDREIEVDGLRFHCLEAGPSDAATVVMLHSGEHASCAELSWERNIPAIADEFTSSPAT